MGPISKDMQRMINAGQAEAVRDINHPLNGQYLEPINISPKERQDMMRDLRDAARDSSIMGNGEPVMSQSQYAEAKNYTLEKQRNIVKQLKSNNRPQNTQANRIRNSKAANAYLSEFEKRHGTNLTPGEIEIFREMDKNKISVGDFSRKVDDTEYETEIPAPKKANSIPTQPQKKEEDDTEYEF